MFLTFSVCGYYSYFTDNDKIPGNLRDNLCIHRLLAVPPNK